MKGYVASKSDGATGRQVGNLVSWVFLNSNSSQLTEILKILITPRIS